MQSRRRDSQGGFALLMVFLMAAIVALMLYQQLPRVAFESEREKEQLLIDRGEQYTRAIQLYYLANNRTWPTSIDDLEKREKRFLRRRYVDPFTGKDEWRIIHTNGGFLTDSLVQKPPVTGNGQNQLAGNTIGNTTNNTTNLTAGNTAGGTSSTDQQPQVNAAVLQRPSDRPITPSSGFLPPAPGQDPSAQPVNTPLPPITLLAQQPGQGALPPITLQPGGINQPGGLPPITLATTGAGGQQVPGQTPGQLRPPQGGPVSPFPGQPVQGGLPGGVPTSVPPGFQIDANGQLVPVTPVATQILNQGTPGQTPGLVGQGPGVPAQPFSPQPAYQPANQPVNQSGTAQGSPNAALNVINQLLTNPRQNTTTPLTGGSNQIGAIAGIASTHKGPSIKVYKDQSQYQLWEFVFSPTASTVPGGGAGGAAGGAGGPAGGPNQPGGFGGAPGGFGGAPGGFGAGPGGFGGPGPGSPPQGASDPGGGQPLFPPGPGR